MSCVFWELGFSLQQWVFSGSVHTFSNRHKLALQEALLFYNSSDFLYYYSFCMLGEMKFLALSPWWKFLGVCTIHLLNPLVVLESLLAEEQRYQSKATARRPHGFKRPCKGLCSRNPAVCTQFISQQGLYVAAQPWNTCMQGSPCSLQSSCALGVCCASALMSAEGKPSSLSYPWNLEDEYLYKTELRSS